MLLSWLVASANRPSGGLIVWNRFCLWSDMKPTPRRFVYGLAFLTLATVAQAHPGHEGHELTWDFQAGVTHPFSGWDHLLALVAVGWWAAQLGGRARWLIPTTFLSLLGLAAFVGQRSSGAMVLDQAIAASVFIIGLLIASAARLPTIAAIALTAVFALFHGLAHGAEMPLTAGFGGYGAGLELASATLLAGGLGLGAWASQSGYPTTRLAGAAVSLVGLALLAS